MRVGIATVYTPGIHGGAEFLVDGLAEAVHAAGHSVQKIAMPFRFEPAGAASKSLDQCLATNYLPYGGGHIDRLICLKFPTYMIPHPDKRVWLLHQHRSAYDLYGTPYGWARGHRDTEVLRQRIIDEDQQGLAGKAPGSARAVFTIAERVSARLRHYNNIESRALYHPPANAAEFGNKPALPYIFVPSRLEGLKRQDLMLRALAVCKKPIQAIFAGTGSMEFHLQQLAHSLGIADRVRFVGAVSRQEMIELYAHCSAVFFGPLDEDYGYVTLEAMLSSKPVITCTDSGGPLEFVLHNETGLIAEPNAEAIADALEMVMNDRLRSVELGRNGRTHYDSLGIGWDHVVETLLAEQIDRDHGLEARISV